MLLFDKDPNLTRATVNECVIGVTSSNETCNCKAAHSGCKNFLFLSNALGLIQPCDDNILLCPIKLMSLPSTEPKVPFLGTSLLGSNRKILPLSLSFLPSSLLPQERTSTCCICSHCLFQMLTPWSQAVLQPLFHFWCNVSRVHLLLLQLAITTCC